MMNKYAFIYLCTAIFLLASASAHVSVNITTLNNTVMPYESATYQLVINNHRGVEDVININTNVEHWIVSPKTLLIPPSETVTTEMVINPRTTVVMGTHRVPLVFESTRTGQLIEESVLLRLSIDLLTQGYPVNVHSELAVEQEVDPRDNFNVKVLLRNNNLRNIEEVVVRITSPLFEERFVTPLEPLSVVRKEFNFALNPVQEPGLYDVNVHISSGEKTLSDERLQFRVQGYSRVSSEREETYNSWFKRIVTLTIKNTGNQARTTTTKYSIGFFERLFSTTTPETQVVMEEGERKYSWDVSVQAQGVEELYVTTNYRPLVTSIAAVIILIILYFLLRSPIVLLKEAMILKEHEQGTNEMKVRVYIKNRSSNTVHQLKIVDKVPRIAEVVTHAHLGTLQPSKVTRSEKRGTIIRWEIESLEPFEERIISYKIRSKLNIVGAMSLPEAKVKFDTRSGRERVARSGRTSASRPS